uniref:Macroglobulin domain-containing protein n=1 Tax=Meloidogyne hapla TaxID=6305 RepID=A0A1I8BV66_MELHA
MISIFICLVLACFVDLSQQKPQQLPTVLLPSIFRWDANNFIYVTQTQPPTLSDESVDINLRVEGESLHGNKTQIFSETIRQKKGIQQQFKFNIPKLDSSKNLLKNFYVSINIDGHPHFSTVLAGAPDVNLINIQTDKAFYRPNERSKDPNGFRIFNKTNNGNLNDNDDSIELEEDDADISNNNEKKLKNAGFLREYFDLPKFLRYGNWRVLAFAGDYEQGSSSRFHTTIRVEEYEIPKFHVFMNLEEITDSPFSLNVDVFARFAHGLKVKGELTLRCLPLDRETSNENDEKEQSPATKKLLSTQLIEGLWAGKVDLKVCGVTEQKHQKIKLIAEVVESGSFLSAKIIKEWDPFNSAFELLRRRSLIEGNAELTTQCISEELSLNGLNHSLIARLGTIAEIKIDNKCLAYIIKARRKLIGGGFSSVETLVLPLLRGFDPFELSLIEINQNKVEYVEGEFIEAIIHNVNGRNFNYALICGNGRELASSGPINDGRIKIQTTESMGNGACVLYVYGSNGKNSETIVDMQLIFTKTGTCPKEVSFEVFK